MLCCNAQTAATERFFSRLAGLSRWRYRLLGPEKSQKQLLAALQEAGLGGATVLEIGCGVGYLHQRLLMTHAAASAVGIDLSEGMLVAARKLSIEMGLGARTHYVQGDFVELASTLADADATILDKVVCCYADAESLVKRSLAKTKRLYALTYPRNRGLTRAGVTVMAALLRLMRVDFRNYIHDPLMIERWITADGFCKQYENKTPVWLTQVYRRER